MGLKRVEKFLLLFKMFKNVIPFRDKNDFFSNP